MRFYVGGTFDLFHSGHVRLLKRCSKLGEVVVGLNKDSFCVRYKRPPIMSLDERVEVVKACRYVDRVVVNWGDEDSRVIIRLVRPTHIVHGDDWTGEGLMKQMGLTYDFLDEWGIEMFHLPYTSGVSTSEIVKRCIESSGTAR